MKDQLCLAHPADPALGSASYSNDFVYIINSGEVRVCTNVRVCVCICVHVRVRVRESVCASVRMLHVL